MKEKNPPEFYDKQYLLSPMSSADLSVNRWEDNGVFLNAAETARDIAQRVGAASILEVGCGRGWVVRHLRNMGLVADGLEYGAAALASSVCGAVFGDLTATLPVSDGAYDLVICNGVLSHIPEGDVLHALSELARVSKGYLWAHILIVWTPTQQHHRTFRPPDWWMEQFQEVGLFRFEGDAEFLKRHGYGFSLEQWGSIWGKADITSP